jgi:hypothetical protein
LIFSFSNTKTAYAHKQRTLAIFKSKLGWSNEPPAVGELNNVIVQVIQTSGKNGQIHVINALGNVDIVVKYGGLTKILDLFHLKKQNACVLAR